MTLEHSAPPPSAHGPSSVPPNGTGHSSDSPDAAHAFAAFAKRAFSRLPVDFDAQLKEHPYLVLGAAFVMGASAGVVLSSRILRTAFASAASVAILELGRTYTRREARPSGQRAPTGVTGYRAS